MSSSSKKKTDPLGATTDIDGEAITVSKAKGAPVTPSPTHDPGQQDSNKTVAGDVIGGQSSSSSVGLNL